MGEISYTPEQRAAIENRGGALLVAAAAGSGKTKVLTERLMARVLGGEGCDIDRFLVITYTRAAAAELKSRIAAELSKRQAEEPANRHLRRQTSLVSRAKIMTIHAFCSELLRQNAQYVGIAPDFRMADEAESSFLQTRALETVLDIRYETIDRRPGFKLLADTMSAGRDDRRLGEIVLDTYSKLQSHPYPERWMEAQMGARLTAAEAGEDGRVKYLLLCADRTATHYIRLFEAIMDELSGDVVLADKYLDNFQRTADALRDFVDALQGGWDQARAALNIPFDRLRPAKSKDPELQARAKQAREGCKAAVKSLAELFDCSLADFAEDMAAVGPAVDELFSLVRDFSQEFSREKAARNALDFNDLEHLAVRLLVDGETGEATEQARAVSERFEEIMVDEYQDVNRVQDMIFGAVSRGGRNVFMVGDVKQSIYRFRLADPTIFLEKYESFRDAGEAAAGEPRKVVLSKNFRSRAGVLAGVNFVFRHVMSRDFGDMDYTEREYLYPGLEYPESGAPAVELRLLDMDAAEDEEESLERSAAEAVLAAKRVRALFDEGTEVYDAKLGAMRPLEYGDVAILLRSAKARGQTYRLALEAEGIPAASDSVGSIFEGEEVCVAVSLLSVIDNPRQDVPLISALRSPVFGFTPDELAGIRSAAKGEFFTALKKRAEEDEKCAAFLSALSSLRELSGELPVDEFVALVYERTLLPELYGAMDGGEGRRANLERLLELARRFENNGYKGLFSFVRYLRHMMELPDSAPAGRAEGQNAVSILSIHKSKGLEYPVVVLCDMAKQFNMDDTRRPLLIHPELGAGPKRTDLQRRIEYPTLARLAIARRIAEESLSEELRVLYVAMTRARERLIMTFSYAKLERQLKSLGERLPLSPETLRSVRSMGDWVLLSALLRPEGRRLRELAGAAEPETEDDGSPWLVAIDAPATPGRRTGGQMRQRPAPPESAVAAIREALSFKYPCAAAEALPSKVTATELKGRFYDYEAAEETGRRPRTAAFRRPSFETRRGLSGAERGIALHLVMQYIDFAACGDIGGIEREIGRLADMRTISREQAAAVEPWRIRRFFRSDTGRRVTGAERLLREFKFSLLEDAGKWFKGADGEELLFQGVVDCCIEESGKLTVIDFKTDYVTAETERARAAEYRGQLEAYALAMEKITGKPVAETLVYFFATGDAIDPRRVGEEGEAHE